MKINSKVKKIICLTLTLIMATTALASCSDSSEVEIPRGMQLASNEKQDYYFFVPTSWTLNDANDFSNAYFSATDKSNVSVFTYPVESEGEMTSYVSAETGKIDPNLYFDKFVEDSKANFPDITVVERKETIFGGQAALQATYTMTMQGVAYKFMQVITPRSAMFYVFTFTSTVEKFDTHLETIEPIVTNFLFK